MGLTKKQAEEHRKNITKNIGQTSKVVTITLERIIGSRKSTIEEDYCSGETFTSLEENIYGIKTLNGEILEVAGLLARTSRAPTDLRTIFFNEELYKEENRETLTRNIYEIYGDKSVGEYSGPAIVIEGLPTHLASLIEQYELASYIEKSTRYKEFKENYIPIDLLNNGKELLENYKVLSKESLELTKEAHKQIAQVLKQIMPINEFNAPVRPKKGGGEVLFRKYLQEVGLEKAQRIYNNAMSLLARDNARYLLPAGVNTMMGIVTNARNFSTIIANCITSDIEDLRWIGLGMAKTISHDLKGPTTIGDPKKSDGTIFRDVLTSEEIEEVKAKLKDNYVKIELYSPLPEAHKIENLDSRIAEKTIFELIVKTDYGLFRDLNRHRNVTARTISPLLHEVLLPEIYENELKQQNPEIYSRIIENIEKRKTLSTQLYENGFEYASQLILPLASAVVSTQLVNARQLGYMLGLRSTPHNHPTFRKITHEIGSQLKEMNQTGIYSSHFPAKLYELLNSKIDYAKIGTRASQLSRNIDKPEM